MFLWADAVGVDPQTFLLCSFCLCSCHALWTWLIQVDLRCVGHVCSENDEICRYPLQTIPLTLPKNLLLTVLRICANTGSKNLLHEANIKEWFPTRCCYFPEQVLFELFICTTWQNCSIYWAYHSIAVGKTKTWTKVFKCRFAEIDEELMNFCQVETVICPSCRTHLPWVVLPRGTKP